jgi:hypothetical protein
VKNPNYRIAAVSFWCSLSLACATSVAPTEGPFAVSEIALSVLKVVSLILIGLGICELFGLDVFRCTVVPRVAAGGGNSDTEVRATVNTRREVVHFENLTDAQRTEARRLFRSVGDGEPFRYVLENDEVHHRVRTQPLDEGSAAR